MRKILLDPQGGEGDGGNVNATPPPAEEPKNKPVDLAKSAENLASKHGSAMDALRVLLHENYQYREKLRDAESKVPDGAIVLKGDDAKAWEAYRGLGKPAEIKQAIVELTETKQTVAGFKKKEDVRKAARIADFDEDVLLSLVEKLDLTFEMVKGKDGKAETEAAIVVDKAPDGSERKTPLTDYAQTQWQKFLPALKPAKAALPGTPPGRFQAPAGAPPREGDRKVDIPLPRLARL